MGNYTSTTGGMECSLMSADGANHVWCVLPITQGVLLDLLFHQFLSPVLLTVLGWTSSSFLAQAKVTSMLSYLLII